MAQTREAEPGINAQKTAPREGWATIDSAPKDGRNLLSFNSLEGVHIAFWRQRLGRWGRYGAASEAAERLSQPTHWMPLPPRPSDGSPLATMASPQADATSDPNHYLRSQLVASRLLIALEPFGEIDGEGDEDFGDETRVTVKFGRSTDYTLTLGDFRRARAAVSAAQESAT